MGRCTGTCKHSGDFAEEVAYFETARLAWIEVRLWESILIVRVMLHPASLKPFCSATRLLGDSLFSEFESLKCDPTRALPSSLHGGSPLVIPIWASKWISIFRCHSRETPTNGLPYTLWLEIHFLIMSQMFGLGNMYPSYLTRLRHFGI
jgi:hypothetical protein